MHDVAQVSVPLNSKSYVPSGMPIQLARPEFETVTLSKGKIVVQSWHSSYSIDDEDVSELEALDDADELSELDALDETDDDSEELKLLDSDELADSLDDTEEDSDELTELELLELSLLDSLDENEEDSDELKELDSNGNSIPVTMIG